MAAALNQVTLIGRLTSDPQLLESSNHIQYTRLNIAVDRNYSGAQGVDFIPFTAWRNNAVYLTNNCKKGDLVLVQGNLTINSWTSKENKKMQTLEISVTNVQMLSRSRGGGSSVNGSNPNPALGNNQYNQDNYQPAPNYNPKPQVSKPTDYQDLNKYKPNNDATQPHNNQENNNYSDNDDLDDDYNIDFNNLDD